MTRLNLSFRTILKEWSFIFFALASGGPTVVLAIFYIIFGTQPAKFSFLAFLGVCSILAGWVQVYRERRKRIDDQVKRTPYLKASTEDFYRINGYVGQPGANSDFISIRLRVTNDPEVGTEFSQATTVSARLTFLGQGGAQLFQIEGRWSDSPQPPSLPQERAVVELNTADIPIGTTRIVDIAIKFNQDIDCYGVNNESYNAAAYSMLRNPAWRLPPGAYNVLLRFRSARIDQTFLLAFINRPLGGELEPLSCEDVTRNSVAEIDAKLLPEGASNMA